MSGLSSDRLVCLAGPKPSAPGNSSSEYVSPECYAKHAQLQDPEDSSPCDQRGVAVYQFGSLTR